MVLSSVWCSQTLQCLITLWQLYHKCIWYVLMFLKYYQIDPCEIKKDCVELYQMCTCVVASVKDHSWRLRALVPEGRLYYQKPRDFIIRSQETLQRICRICICTLFYIVFQMVHPGTMGAYHIHTYHILLFINFWLQSIFPHMMTV